MRTSIKMYDTLILSGNSTNAIVTMGALQHLYDKKLLDRVKNFIGTSSGSILSLLLCIGYTPLDLLCFMCTEKVYKKMHTFNIGNMLLGKGALMTFEPITNSIESLVTNKLGFIPTMVEVKNMFDTNLVCVTYNLTKDERVYISPATHPHLSVLIALRMSSTFPFVFDPVEYEGAYFIDGGLVDNFAIEHGEKLGEKCLGIYTHNPHKKFEGDTNTIDFFYKLLVIFTNNITQDKIKRTVKSDIIQLNHNMQFFRFNMANQSLIDLFDKGCDLCKESLMGLQKDANHEEDLRHMFG